MAAAELPSVRYQQREQRLEMGVIQETSLYKLAREIKLGGATFFLLHVIDMCSTWPYHILYQTFSTTLLFS